MKPFRFPFDRVLRVRRLQEVGARAEYLGARAVAESAEARVLKQGRELELARETLGRMQSSARLAPLEILRQGTAIDALEGALERSRLEARTRSREAERLRQDWQERRAGVRGLERLEALRRAAHGKELESVEAREADERALVVETSSRGGRKAGTQFGHQPLPGSRSSGSRSEETLEAVTRCPQPPGPLDLGPESPTGTP